ncbi:MAG: MBL fold metallo-hydrolase [Candidatus Aureabacteria bacterium]|nr:MBL fold metallo-hydrolase [Candidatus Auribacterota bacterium]
MKLTILGSGVCIPTSDRCQSSYLIQTNNSNILFDIGSGALYRLTQANIDYFSIDVICITHKHCDHMSDFIPFLFATNNHPTVKRTKELKLIGPPGIKKHIEELFNVYNHWIEPETYSLNIIEAFEGSFEIDKNIIDVFSVKHCDNSNGYCITDEFGKVFAYSGDASFGENLVKYVKNAQVLLLECSFPDKKLEKHLNINDVSMIIDNAQCKKLILTHIYPGYEDFDFKASLNDVYSGEVYRAKDLDVYDF